jgi:hypothetical protein
MESVLDSEDEVGVVVVPEKATPFGEAAKTVMSEEKT